MIKSKKFRLENGKVVETPINFYGISFIESNRFHLEYFRKYNISNIISNAFDYMGRFNDNWIKGRERLLDTLSSQSDLIHIMDSGGFQLLSNSSIIDKFNPIDVFKIQLNSNADICPQLDLPVPIHLSLEEKKRRIDRNIENYMQVYDYNKDNDLKKTIIPIIKGYEKEIIDYNIDKLREISGNITIVGYGGMLPLLKNEKNYAGYCNKYSLIKRFLYLKNRFADSFVHIFGLSSFIGNIAFLCGIESIDSSSWIRSSAKYRISPLFDDKMYVRKPIKSKIGILKECGCDICKGRFKISNFTSSNRIGLDNRVEHNLYTMNREMEMLKIGNYYDSKLEYYSYIIRDFKDSIHNIDSLRV